MNYDNYYKNGGMTKEESISAIALRIGARKDAVAKFVEEHDIDTNKLNSDLKSGKVFFMDVITGIVGKPNNKYQKEIIKKYGSKMAMGGKTQGYDDREDERLAMKHGKISGKDFVGSHDMREHSRRDDARFEKRMADGGETERDKNGMLYALQEHVSSGEIASKTNATKYEDIDKIRSKAIQYYMENGDKPYSYAELESVLKKFDHTKFADGGYIDEDQLHELARLVMDSIDYTVELSLDEFILYVTMTGYQRELCKYVLKMFDEYENPIHEDQLHELARLVMDSIDYTVELSLDEFILYVNMTGYQEKLCKYVLKMFDEYDNPKPRLGEVEEFFLVRKGMFEYIKNYYLNEYPTDELGADINPEADFDGLLMVLNEGDDVYEYLGVTDSLVRERVFEKLANIMGVEYNVIYDMWLSSDEKFAEGGAIKGSNPSTGEKFGVVIGSLKKEDELTTLTIRSGYSSRIQSYQLVFDEKGFLREIGDFGFSIDGTYPDMKRGHMSVKNVYADNKKESIDAIAKITSPSFAKKVYDYVQDEKMAKGGEIDGDKSKSRWDYTDVDDIEYVVVKDKDGKELKFAGKYVLSGVHDLLEKGGKLSEKGKYYSKDNVVSVVVGGKNIIDKNTVSGVWIMKDAKPVAEDVVDMKIGKTTIKKGHNGWVGKTMVENFKGYDWDITTIKNYNGDLTTTAQGGKNEKRDGYGMFTFMLYQDPNIRLKVSRPARVTDKVVTEQHEQAVKEFKERADEIAQKVDEIQSKKKMADGGAIGFDALAKKVAKNYEGDKVKKEFQKEYGKTYDKKEAEEVGKKVAAKVYRQQQANKGKMKKGGRTSSYDPSESKMTKIARKASEIRKENESWRDAFNRAKAIIG